MRNRILPSAVTLVACLAFPTALCFSSCTTTSPKSEPPKKSARVSPEQERYKKTVEDQLGPLWYRLVEIHEDSLDLGTVTTTFEIPAAGGRVRNLRIKSNTGGRMAELVARRAIDQLRAPPVPSVVLVLAHQDYLFMEELFTLYDKREDQTPPPPPPKKG